MFIGINPGAGFYNYEGRRVKRLSPLEHMEYIGQDYKLATETRELLRLAGIPNSELNNSVKTNYYFLSCKSKTLFNKSELLAVKFVRIFFSSTPIILKTPSIALLVV